MPRAIQKRYNCGAILDHNVVDYVPATSNVRPTQDRIVVEPVERQWSDIIYVANEGRPFKGIVRAVGPGKYRLGYKDEQGRITHERKKRKQVYETKAFVPTSVKVGDTVYVAGNEEGGFAYQMFYWGEALCFIATERDVTGVEIQ